MTTQTPDAVREATMVLDVFLAAYARRSDDMPVFLDRDDDNLLRWGHLRTILAALDSLAGDAGEGWKDIASAPKDGSTIILWAEVDGGNRGAAYGPVMAAWVKGCTPGSDDLDIGFGEDGGWLVSFTDGCIASAERPTHWMPKPSAPNATPAPAVDAVPAGEVEQAGQFLLDRLVDHEVRMTSDADAREWHGHVTPAMARFRAALSHGEGRK